LPKKQERMKHIAIFASGSGSNAEQLASYFDNHSSIKVSCIVSNRKQAGVFGRLSGYKEITPLCIAKDDWSNEGLVLDLLQKHQVDFIVLAGFLLKVPAYLIKRFQSKIINIHPALLPKYGGKGMYGAHVHEAVKSAEETESGITIHLVNEEFDKGEMIFQARCKIDKSDSAADIAKKVQMLEHEHFAEQVVQQILKSC
jgi:phosphoribosylglycinamide formyltransferase-1